jgi:hypothetical protein
LGRKEISFDYIESDYKRKQLLMKGFPKVISESNFFETSTSPKKEKTIYNNLDDIPIDGDFEGADIMELGELLKNAPINESMNNRENAGESAIETPTAAVAESKAENKSEVKVEFKAEVKFDVKANINKDITLVPNSNATHAESKGTEDFNSKNNNATGDTKAQKSNDFLKPKSIVDKIVEKSFNVNKVYLDSPIPRSLKSRESNMTKFDQSLSRDLNLLPAKTIYTALPGQIAETVKVLASGIPSGAGLPLWPKKPRHRGINKNSKYELFGDAKPEKPFIPYA